MPFIFYYFNVVVIYKFYCDFNFDKGFVLPKEKKEGVIYGFWVGRTGETEVKLSLLVRI
jgi:hypothetical protein